MLPGHRAVLYGDRCPRRWAPYDTYDGVAGHGLCGAHVLRGVAAVTENGTDLDVIWHSRQSTPSWPSRTLPTPPAR